LSFLNPCKHSIPSSNPTPPIGHSITRWGQDFGRCGCPRTNSFMVWKRDHVCVSGSQNTSTQQTKMSSHVHASHFWLNEGWTTYMERVLQQILHGPAERGFSYVIGNKALRNDLERYMERPKYQRLVIDFEPGEDPDEAYSSVPYEKGANLLLHLGMPPSCISFIRTSGYTCARV